MQGLYQAVDLVYFWNYQYMIGSAYNAKITEEQVLRAIVKRGHAPPRLKKKGDLFLVNFHCIYTNTLILVNMQCLQYVYYSLLF